MGMAARIPMRIEVSDSDALLTLAQWFSPSYPLGSFAYSHGLEWSVAAGDVTSADQVAEWVRALLEHGSGRNDAIFLAQAYAATSADALAEIDELARAMAPSRERLQETLVQGAAFARTTADIWGTEDAALTLPVAVGAAAHTCALPLRPVLEFYLHSFASNLISAGIRLVPLGQTEGQAALASLKPTIRHQARAAATATLDDLAGAVLMVDIASMKHETQYTRLFRS